MTETSLFKSWFAEQQDLARHVDQGMLVLLIALVSIGFVMMSSASMDFALSQYHNGSYFVLRELVFISLAIAVFIMVFTIPTTLFNRYDKQILVAALVLLILVLIVGKEVNGSKRWINFGLINLQVSELAKLFLIIYMAGYLVRRQEKVRNSWAGLLNAGLVLTIVVGLLLFEPDFGSAVVIVFSVMGMIFLAGLGVVQLVALLFLIAIGAFFAVFLTAYRMKRITCFADPWEEPYSCGYQLVQSLIAFGRGDIWGLGLGKSVQKLFFLPEAHTDFIFAIVAEELGFVGAVIVIALFAALIYRVLRLALRAQAAHQMFNAYFAFGAGLLLTAQVFINIGVNSGLLPTKGLTLPFLSYGGSSLIMMAAMFAMLFRIDAQLTRVSTVSQAENLRGRRLA